MRSEFIESVNNNQAAFGLKLSEESIDRLADFYGIILENNEILHLVGPSTPEEFALRHILESLTLLEHLPDGARLADVGTGGGLPSIPCLLVRDDLKALLIETKEKKAKFLAVAVERLGITARVEIADKQFNEVDPANCESVTCRALDKFTERLPRLLKWRMRRQLLLFGGPNLRDALKIEKAAFKERRMPMSQQRYLFIVDR
ncbi:MAG: RsmG family class I SAM-dependent methyltransferase [Acidobacteriota bacterium]